MNREQYIKCLIEQFKLSTGTKNIDINSTDFLKDFRNWITKNNFIGQRVLTLLEECSIEYDIPTFAEINKGYLDSIASSYETTIITPYTYNLDKRVGEGKVIDGIFKVTEQTPKLDSKEMFKPDTIISPKEINRFMVHNPYENFNVDMLARLHKNDNYNGIIFSVYGDSEDKNKNEKEKMFLDLRSKLYDGYTDENMSFGDSYCYVLASDKLKKILSKKLSK